MILDIEMDELINLIIQIIKLMYKYFLYLYFDINDNTNINLCRKLKLIYANDKFKQRNIIMQHNNYA